MLIKTFIKIYAFLFIVTCFVTSCNTNSNTEKTEVSTKPIDEISKLNISESTVYTTSSLNNVKLQLTSANIAFSDFKQPLETEASIFVTTSKSHQTFVGIGAALTDASAETFYKLNKNQQHLFM